MSMQYLVFDQTEQYVGLDPNLVFFWRKCLSADLRIGLNIVAFWERLHFGFPPPRDAAEEEQKQEEQNFLVELCSYHF